MEVIRGEQILTMLQTAVALVPDDDDNALCSLLSHTLAHVVRQCEIDKIAAICCFAESLDSVAREPQQRRLS